MPQKEIEFFLYGGESPKNRLVFEQYRKEVQSGKSLLQLKAVAESITPHIRNCWSPRSFTPIQTSIGRFDEVVCNISYHFYKHGQKYGTIQRMTDEALRYFRGHRKEAIVRKIDGLLLFPNHSLFEANGKIVTFIG